ncbi:LPXTG cell wall anchor domain-containing protein [Amycolatopsis sp. NPDC058986]
MSRRPVRATLGVLALTTVTLLGTATSAFACHTDDGRAKPIPGSVTKCEQVKKEQLSHEDVSFTGGDGEKYLNITAVGEGVKVTAIVVEGGKDGYNVYEPGKLADLPWKELRAPKTVDNRDAKIDHWFLCGSKTDKPTSSPSKPAEPTKAPTSSAAPTSAAPSTSDTAAPSTTAVPAPAIDAGGANGGGLANTGFDNGWLIWVGALLLLGGGSLLTLLKLRRRAQ